MKKLSWILVGIFIFAAGVGIYLYNKPHKKISALKADYTISAVRLWDDYTDEKYLDKVIIVEGMIRELSVDQVPPGLILETNDDFGGIVCQFDQHSTFPDLSGFSSGDFLSVKGHCTGKLMDIVLDRCIIVESQNKTE